MKSPDLLLRYGFKRSGTHGGEDPLAEALRVMCAKCMRDSLEQTCEEILVVLYRTNIHYMS
jgi:hypothetical protein